MTQLFIILIALICPIHQAEAHKEFNYGNLANGVISSYSQRLEKTKGLTLIGSGGSWTSDIRTIRLHFWTIQEFDIAKVRRLFIDSVEGLIREVNGKKEARPYLHNFPFTVDNIELIIGFLQTNQKHVTNGYVSLVFNISETIYYNVYNERTQQHEDLYKESFSEALNIVNKEKALKTFKISDTMSP